VICKDLRSIWGECQYKGKRPYFYYLDIRGKSGFLSLAKNAMFLPKTSLKLADISSSHGVGHNGRKSTIMQEKKKNSTVA